MLLDSWCNQSPQNPFALNYFLGLYAIDIKARTISIDIHHSRVDIQISCPPTALGDELDEVPKDMADQCLCLPNGAVQLLIVITLRTSALRVT
jgi:hypothetical protein